MIADLRARCLSSFDKEDKLIHLRRELEETNDLLAKEVKERKMMADQASGAKTQQGMMAKEKNDAERKLAEVQARLDEEVERGLEMARKMQETERQVRPKFLPSVYPFYSRL